MKKKIIIISIIVVVLIIIIIAATSGSGAPEYVTAPVEFGQVQQTVDATGSVASSQSIQLNFKTTGRISAMNVKVGDTLIAGQTLASLEAGALSSRVADAQSVLLEAQANLDKVLSGSTPEDIKVSEVTVQQKQQDLVAAQNNLVNLAGSRDVELANLKNTAIVKLNNELVVAEVSLEIIDNTLDYKDAQDTLGALNSDTVAVAANSQLIAINSVAAVRAAIANLDQNSADAEVLDALSQLESALEDVRLCLSDVFKVLENTITSSKLSQTELDGLITDIKTEQTAVSTSKTNLQTAETNWTNKQVYYTDQITKAEDSLAAAEDSLDLAQAQLDLKKADPANYEIASAQAGVAKAQANLALAKANLGDTLIRAPVSGTIVKINNQAGEQTSLASPVIEMIGQSNLEIEVNIPESDIAKVALGQAAEITLDSFGDDLIFAGSVTFVDPAETLVQEVVYYQVKVQFLEPAENIKPGMTANVIIMTTHQDNVLRVPLRAVKQTNGDKVVDQLINGQSVETQVTTGLRGDEFMEITAGLKEGDQVITFVKNGQ